MSLTNSLTDTKTFPEQLSSAHFFDKASLISEPDIVKKVDVSNSSILESPINPELIVLGFAEKMIKNMKPLDPEYSKIVSENFWDLV